MDDEVESNRTERRRWNDEYWSAVWPRREQLTGAVTPVLFEHAGLKPGQRVLDIGSGAGITSLAAASVVSPRGRVVGADISRPLVDFATARAREEGLSNLDFVVVDAQEDQVPGSPFDVAISQFGVMFFERPERAFDNIRSHLRPGGLLTFACWRPISENPWQLSFALGRFLPPAGPLDPGASPTGPFALADAARTTDLLRSTGWYEIRHTPHDVAATVERDAIVDEDQLEFLGVPAGQHAEAMAAVRSHLDAFRSDADRYTVTLAIHIFSARA